MQRHTGRSSKRKSLPSRSGQSITVAKLDPETRLLPISSDERDVQSEGKKHTQSTFRAPRSQFSGSSSRRCPATHNTAHSRRDALFLFPFLFFFFCFSFSSATFTFARTNVLQVDFCPAGRQTSLRLDRIRVLLPLGDTSGLVSHTVRSYFTQIPLITHSRTRLSFLPSSAILAFYGRPSQFRQLVCAVAVRER